MLCVADSKTSDQTSERLHGTAEGRFFGAHVFAFRFLSVISSTLDSYWMQPSKWGWGRVKGGGGVPRDRQ